MRSGIYRAQLTRHLVRCVFGGVCCVFGGVCCVVPRAAFPDNPRPTEMADFTVSYANAIAAKRLIKTFPIGSTAHGVAVTAMHAANAIYFDDRLRILFPAEWIAKEARVEEARVAAAARAEEARVAAEAVPPRIMHALRDSGIRAKMIRLGLAHLLPPPPLVSMLPTVSMLLPMPPLRR